MNRIWQIVLIVSTAGFSWLAMMVVHELGHVLHAGLSGATVVQVVLHPASFSRTDVDPNPWPLFVATGGVVWGCLIPLGLLAIIRRTASRHAYLAAFFAGFCLIANGAYLVAGAFLSGGLDDAGVILQHGGIPSLLVVLGVAAVAAGLYLLHGLGPHFGLGPARRSVDPRAAMAMAAGWLLLILVEIWISR